MDTFIMYYTVSGPKITFMFEVAKSIGYASIGIGDEMEDADMVIK